MKDKSPQPDVDVQEMLNLTNEERCYFRPKAQCTSGRKSSRHGRPESTVGTEGTVFRNLFLKFASSRATKSLEETKPASGGTGGL